MLMDGVNTGEPLTTDVGMVTALEVVEVVIDVVVTVTTPGIVPP